MTISTQTKSEYTMMVWSDEHGGEYFDGSSIAELQCIVRSFDAPKAIDAHIYHNGLEVWKKSRGATLWSRVGYHINIDKDMLADRLDELSEKLACYESCAPQELVEDYTALKKLYDAVTSVPEHLFHSENN